MNNSRIKILDSDTIAKISAGEVIERPASVVKELVENSIDADPSNIEVEVRDGGRSRIRVTDDGIGMSCEEAELSLKRHSTSKISSAEDLFAVSTLGFRGEALPSIGAVSKLEITSSPRGGSGSEGTLIKVAGGHIEKIEPVGCPEGTTVKASELFFNTPARKKYLKSDSTELSHIVEVISKYALARPNISFKLISNGETLIFSPGKGSSFDAFAAVHGLDIAREAVPVEYRSGYADIKGFVVRPTVTRVDRSLESFFVNGRFIKNTLLSRSLEDAYRTLIPHDRRPIASIFIEINPREVDVNVHPTKREVRFAKTREVFTALKAAVAKALEIKEGEGAAAGFSGELPTFLSADPAAAERLFEVISAPREGNSGGGFGPVFQVLNTYIVAQEGDGFVVLDQHAAHERVLFDKLRDERRETRDERSQKLLVPENLELDQSGAITLKENQSFLKETGFEIEEFGKGSFIIRAVPAKLSEASAKETLNDMIDEMRGFGRAIAHEQKLEAIQKLVACHSAIKAGDPLTGPEIASLFEDLRKTSNPYTCPHGRPTMVRFSKADLEKIFKRV